MYENGKVVDSMNVIVGNAETQTPMMAAELSYVQLNPYWNVPPELVQSLVAKNVLEQG
jgi:L,D-transpeptidase YcbB